VSLAGRNANETTPTGGQFRLFTTSTTLAGATSLDARFGVRLTRRLRGLVSGSYGRPTLRIGVADDVENASSVTATERIQQFAVRGGASWSVLTGARFAPFAAAEIGYLRELHDAQTLVQTAPFVEIGGGGSYPFRSPGTGPFGRIGARVDARAVLRSKGAALDGGVHAFPAFSVGLYLGF